jgi:hypothetical protein
MKVTQEEIWYKATEKRPPFNEPVWGLWKGQEVQLVKIALTEHEWENYDDFCECAWYSLEEEKCRAVTHWMPLNRPKFNYGDN